MKPKVTIGVCVKNCEELIKETIDSILNQDFPYNQMEIIFVDDGSEDNTLSIINSNVKKININSKIFHHDWRGLGVSRNVVVNNAEGKYIVWVDGDMVLSNEYIKKVVNFMEKNPKVGIAKGKYSLLPGANWISTLEIYSRVAKNLVDFNKTSKSMGTGGSIYRVKAIGQVKGFNGKIKGYGEDWEIENRIRNCGWLFGVIDVELRDYERNQITWKDLWRRYFKRGYDMHYFPKDARYLLNLYGMTPPAAFILGLLFAFQIYKLTRNKLAFLLPIQHMFKMSAWCYGYIRALFI